MQKQLIAATLTIIILTLSSAFGQCYWKKTYDRIFNPIMVSQPGGTVVIAGATTAASATDSNADIRIMRINASGDTFWTKTYGEWDGKSSMAILGLPDTTVLAVGKQSKPEKNGLRILKVNQQGETVWRKTYFDSSGGVFGVYKMIVYPDNSVIILVSRSQVVATMENTWAVKINAATGDTLWTKEIITNSYGIEGIEQPFNGLLVFGQIGQPLDPPSIFAAKVNTLAGQTEWNTIFGTHANLAAVVPQQDNSALICANYPETWLLKVDTENGDTVWTKSCTGHAVTMVSAAGGSSVVITGDTFSSANGSKDLWVRNVTAKGETAWIKTYGGLQNDEPTALLPEPDGTTLIVGSTASFGAGARDLWLVKVDASGDTLWTKTFGGTGDDVPAGMLAMNNGRALVIGARGYSGTDSLGLWLLSIVDDRHAYRDSLFTFKVPVADDSLRYSYSALKNPPGMRISSGGTVTWTPTTDSIYKENVVFRIVDHNGRSDTLDFNIWVNGVSKTAVKQPLSNHAQHKGLDIISTALPHTIVMTLPQGASTIMIYDCHGRLVRSLQPAGESQKVWNGRNQSGKSVRAGIFVVKILTDRQAFYKTLSLVR